MCKTSLNYLMFNSEVFKKDERLLQVSTGLIEQAGWIHEYQGNLNWLASRDIDKASNHWTII